MRVWPQHRCIAWVLSFLVVTLPAAAEEMPVRAYTTSDGLVRNEVFKIKRDSRGFLWFGTVEGLSIFDGYQFTNYTTADGLPNQIVTDLLETRSGDYWIATNGGLCRYNAQAAKPEQRFVTYRLGHSKESNQVNSLLERRDGSVWAGTQDGVWRLTFNGTKTEITEIPLPWPTGDIHQVSVLLADHREILWAGSDDGLYALWPSGAAARFSTANGLPGNQTHDIFEDKQGRLWAGTVFGLAAIVADPQPGKRVVRRVYSAKDGLVLDNTISIFQSSDGKLWVGSLGLYEFRPDASGRQKAFHPVATPFGQGFFFSIAEDIDRNLWAAADANGVVKITRHGFNLFSGADGLLSPRIHSVSVTDSGDVYVIAGIKGHTIHHFENGRFARVDPRLPPGFTYSWGAVQITFQDREGEWWVPTAKGLLRYAAPGRLSLLAQQLPRAIYTTRQGLPGNIILRAFEDSRGDIWIGCFEGLARWDRKTEKIRAYAASEVVRDVPNPPSRMVTTNYFAEDGHGSIWIGFYPSGLARFRDGRFDFFSESDGLPRGQILALYVDHLGRLWVASSQGGVSRIDDTAAAQPAFHTYSTTQGLSSNQVFSIVEDQSGRFYVAGGRGVDRLDPATGVVRRFTLGEDLPSFEVTQMARDRDGALWFASGNGLSRYVPEPDPPLRPQAPLIRRLWIAGKLFPVSDFGESDVPGLRLDPAQNSLRIEYASLHFAFGEVLRYQYRMEGADKDWSSPTDLRTVNYANLSPGTYRFVVQAVNGNVPGNTKATVGFVVLPPVWQRWWFVSLSVCMVFALLYSAYRYRLRQILAIERIRTRLASDLHDDIGSGLVEIAIASEIAKSHRGSGAEQLQQVGDRARQLRESITDIVWSVDPRHDHLEDVVGRIRQSAFSLLESNGCQVEVHAPDSKALSSISLAADRRRHLLLVCKEALANVARHADASRVSVGLSLQESTLTLEVLDNGRGFDPEVSHTGLGLRSMRRRAGEVGSKLIVESAPGRGTRLEFSLPLS